MKGNPAWSAARREWQSPSVRQGADDDDAGANAHSAIKHRALIELNMLGKTAQKQRTLGGGRCGSAACLSGSRLSVSQPASQPVSSVPWCNCPSTEVVQYMGLVHETGRLDLLQRALPKIGEKSIIAQRPLIKASSPAGTTQKKF